ncbi:MAG: hypothetical protein IPN90_03135 [Elusimicrobia bacterium]|nr:hypothetical protein [Elusimicrobiota bacterium]
MTLKISQTLLAFSLFWAAIVNGKSLENNPSPGSVFWMEATGTINPVVKDYLLNGLEQAQLSGAAAVIIRLDTPGGLLDATRDIVQGLLNAPLPVIVFVGPQGPGRHRPDFSSPWPLMWPPWRPRLIWARRPL